MLPGSLKAASDAMQPATDLEAGTVRMQAIPSDDKTSLQDLESTVCQNGYDEEDEDVKKKKKKKRNTLVRRRPWKSTN